MGEPGGCHLWGHTAGPRQPRPLPGAPSASLPFAPSLPSPAGAVPARAASRVSAPARARGRSGKRRGFIEMLACALPAATPPAPDQRPPAAEAATKGPLQRAVPRCARRADTPEFAPLFSAGTGEGRGKGRGRAEGSGRELPAGGALDAGAACGPGSLASRGPTSPASLVAVARHEHRQGRGSRAQGLVPLRFPN